MVELLIKNKATKLKLEVPEKASEMRLRQYIDFIRYYDKWLLKEKEFGLFSYESILGLSNLVAKFFEIDSKQLLGLKIDFEDFAAGAEILSKHKVNNAEVTDKLMSIVCFIKNVVDNLEPKALTAADHHFIYKGEKYCLPYFTSKKYLNTKTRPPLDLGQLIEMHEIQRVFSQRRAKEEQEYLKKRKMQLTIDDEDEDEEENSTPKTKSEIDKKLLADFIYDPEGNYMLEECLKALAVLAVKHGDKHAIPATDTLNYITDKMWHFIDIDLQTWADADFFLTCIGQELSLTPNSITSLILLKELALNQKNNQN